MCHNSCKSKYDVSDNDDRLSAGMVFWNIVKSFDGENPFKVVSVIWLMYHCKRYMVNECRGVVTYLTSKFPCYWKCDVPTDSNLHYQYPVEWRQSKKLDFLLPVGDKNYHQLILEW